ncbi:MAG: hypothetical protein IPN78_11525 [Candidatus Accumulibacter sp.]|nr:hypothetical protein [Candidatus Accumulibacter propinquus]
MSIDISNLPGPLPAKENDWAWSNADALALVEQLRNQEDGFGRNFMGNALRNFLALYSVTRQEESPGGPGWYSLPVTNGELARSALFGDGSLQGSLIGRVIIGAASLLKQSINE